MSGKDTAADRLISIPPCCHIVSQEPGALVFVAGASGGVGQLVTAKLTEVCNVPQASFYDDAHHPTSPPHAAWVQSTCPHPQ